MNKDKKGGKKGEKSEKPRVKTPKNKEIAQNLLRIFYHNPDQNFNYKQLGSTLGINDDAGRAEVQKKLEELLAEKLITELESGKYKALPQTQYVVGKLDVTAKGSAYLVPEKKDPDTPDIFIPAANIGKGIHGDLVKVYAYHRKGMQRPEGEVVEIIERKKNKFVGVLQMSKGFGFVVPDNHRINIDLYIPKENLNNAQDGDKVVAEIVEWPERAQNPIGQITDVLGRPGEHDVEIHSILADYDLPYKFEQEIEDAASALPIEITEQEISRRRDMRGVTTFTIDPFDAKDFDDAISIRRLESGNWEVGVHIADVTHYLQEGGTIDQEAYNRGTSVYLVDRVVPMLPEILCNNVCSLRPNEEKLTFSAVFELNEKAEVKSEWIGKTVIYSDCRFTYEQAQAIIEGGDDPLKEEVLELDRLAKLMKAERMRKGALSFDKAEVKFNLDEHNEPMGVYFKISKDSNHLVEEFMLLANRKVAEYAGRILAKGKEEAPTFVYRVHDDPNPDKLLALSNVAKQFGYKILTKDRSSISSSLNNLLTQSRGKGEANMMETLAMRSMAKAEYSTDNIGHYGLAFDYYTHFTSPIRRYPDMMVHRLLHRYLGNGKSVDKETYAEMCRYSSSREKVAADAERDSVKYMQVKFMDKHMDEQFTGIISGVTEWGIYVEISENKCEGMVKIREIRDDYYTFDPKNFCLVGERSGNIIRLGDEVVVKVKKTDLERKQLDFELMATMSK